MDISTTQLVQLHPQAVSIWTEDDHSDEIRVRIQGDLQLQPGRHYDQVSIEYTLRSAESRVLVRDDNRVDLEFSSDGQVTFSHTLHLRRTVVEDTASITLRANARIIEVARSVTLDFPRPTSH